MVWERNTSRECPTEDMGSTVIAHGSTSYKVTGLQENSHYFIVLVATNTAGSVYNDSISQMTKEASEDILVRNL